MSALSVREPPAIVHYAPPLAQGDEAQALAKLVENARRPARPLPPAFTALPLPLHLASYLATRWQEPCEGAFEYLAASHPSNLFDVISSGLLDPADLTFAAEIAGRVPDSKAVRRALLPLLSHREAVVREGAIYGLHQHTDDVVRESLERIAAGDASSAVRRAAVDALEGV